MAKWLNKIEIKKEWKQAEEGEITRLDLAKKISEEIRKIQFVNNESENIRDEAIDIADFFDEYVVEGEDDVSYFNFLMKHLYDWGDVEVGKFWPPHKVCWIET